MLKAYIRSGIMLHMMNQSPGAIVFIAMSGFIANFSVLEFDPLHSSKDFFSFVGFMILLFLAGIQFLKGYLIYIPSTYLRFSNQGISFIVRGKEKKNKAWTDIDRIDLVIETEWLLSLVIVDVTGETIQAELVKMWPLSIFKRPCVYVNFLRLLDVANKEPNLMNKLDQDQLLEISAYCKLT